MANRTNKGNRPRWPIAALGVAIGLVVAGAAMFSTALAVHDAPFPFEIDGNVTDPAGGLDDWQGVFGLGGVTPPATGGPIPSNQSVFIDDLPPTNQDGLPSNRESQYDAGKDVLDVTDWTRKNVAKVVPDKDNILNAYAKNYPVDHDGNPATPDHSVIYFGADRFANNGDAALGFWFFQQKVELEGQNGFGPAHTARNGSGQRGDILVQVDFVGGGGSSEIQIFEWVGTFDADGDGDPGGDFGPLQELAFASANGSTVCADLNGTPDVACATTNNAPTGSYWPYQPKAGSAGTFPSESFFEGGIDLTAVAGNICLNSFLANTRTSHSETADLKDLALGDFNTCGNIDLVAKTCQAVAGVSPLYDGVNDVYQYVHDVTIRNDGGGGSIFDVGFRDDTVTGITLGTHNRCAITAITGGTGHALTLPYQLANNLDFVEVANTLAPGIANQMTVTVQCDSPLRDLHNAASVQAGQSPGGTSLTDSIAQDDAAFAACPTNFPAALTITKSCLGDVILDPATFQPEVCVQYVIENTSGPGTGTVAQKIDIDDLDDTRMDGTTQDLKSLLPDLVLDIGEINTIDDCYFPTKPDSDQTDPDLVTYSDSATILATGRADTQQIEMDSNTASCPLCPVGLDSE